MYVGLRQAGPALLRKLPRGQGGSHLPDMIMITIGSSSSSTTTTTTMTSNSIMISNSSGIMI